MVSVVTLSYGEARFLEHTIPSVLNHDHPNLECMMIVLGTAGSSADITRTYECRLRS